MTQKTFTFTNERISSENRADGRHVVQVTPGGTKILASIVGGEITQYEAEDATGNYRSLFSVSQLIPPGSHIVDPGFPGTTDSICWVCTDDIDGSVFCYQIECPPVPPPPTPLPA